MIFCDSIDAFPHIFLHVMLPDSNHIPSFGFKKFIHLCISSGIPFQFSFPILCIGFRQSPVKDAIVPKTTIHKYRHPFLQYYNIRFAD